MRLPIAQDVLIERLAAVSPRVVVVLSAGAPVEMPWLDKVQGLVAGYLGGQASGAAIADILLGRINPSGKLAESWPVALEQTPAYNYFPGGPHQVEYRESIFVGYRYYDTAGVPVAFAFGHGLSYTHFEYTDARAYESSIDISSTVTVSVSIKNRGPLDGAEIVQVYVRPPRSGALRPKKELRGFCKLRLNVGEEKTASFALERRAFAYFDSEYGDWLVESGEYQILFGSSSADIRASVTISIEGDRVADTPSPDRGHYLRLESGALTVSDEEFARTMVGISGDRFPDQYHLNSLLGEVRSTRIGKLLYGVALRSTQEMAKRSNDEVIGRMLERTVAEMPLRQLVAFSGGKLTFATMEMLLAFMNGRWLEGVKRLLFRNQIG